jgi:hypothetical protein
MKRTGRIPLLWALLVLIVLFSWTAEPKGAASDLKALVAAAIAKDPAVFDPQYPAAYLEPRFPAMATVCSPWFTWLRARVLTPEGTESTMGRTTTVPFVLRGSIEEVW